ncbi:hypothetical protein [Microvirga lenta]|uniref:hypothetical protein n=1 Tax=Microvirga lenta TaxID=2881337 RepID=UPI001CFF68C8|nr:hypothetical protein [Microvirga lenta]MCB5174820.1 hypothetical protein [Microvirga lenta]
MIVPFKTLTAAAFALGGAMALQSAPASAQVFYGVPAYEGGTVRYFSGVPVGARAVRPYRPVAGYYGSRYGYRPAYYGPRYRYGYPYRYGYRRSYNGGAVAAGLIGGLALGAIASAAANPYYYSPGYYQPTYYAPARTCFTERRRIVNRYGRVIVRRVQTCY